MFNSESENKLIVSIVKEIKTQHWHSDKLKEKNTYDMEFEEQREHEIQKAKIDGALDVLGKIINGYVKG